MAPLSAPLFSSADIDRVLERVRSLGVEWRGTRFEKYRDELAAQVSSTPAFVESFRGDEQRQRLMFEAGAQLVQVVMAERVFDLLDTRLLAASLRIIFDRGPELDAPSDDRPRNTLLELVVAALLAGRFTPELTKRNEDVRLIHPVIGRGAVESKRPLHAGTLLSNLETIGEQLRARARLGSQYGVAVIGGDRIAQTSGHAYQAETPDEAYSGIQARALSIAGDVDHHAADPACSLVPAACHAIVIVTGAVLVRKPRPILHPISCVIELPVGPLPHSPALQRAFQARRGPALADMLVDHRFGLKR